MMLFFDKFTPLDGEKYRTSEVWVYDLRTNTNLTLVTNSLKSEHLADFVECFKAGNFDERHESERFKRFEIAEILKRDKTNLDIVWLKDESLMDSENLPEPDEILAEILGDLKTALGEIENI